MIQARRSDGGRRRARKPGEVGRCCACGGRVVSAGVRASYHVEWAHPDGRCPGPRDGWADGILDALAVGGFQRRGRVAAWRRVALLLSDGPEPDEDVDEREREWAEQGYRVVWLVDGRWADLAMGRSCPGMPTPTWLKGTPWSAFTQAWLARDVPVVIHTAHVSGWPTEAHRAAWFACEVPADLPVDPRKAKYGVSYRLGPHRPYLSGLPSIANSGRLVTLADVVAVARAIGDGDAWDRTVSITGLCGGGDSMYHATRRGRAPFSTAPVHFLDSPLGTCDVAKAWR